MQSLSTQSIFKIIPGSAAAWATATFSNTVTDAKYMPPNVLLFETDTRKLKVSDGVATSYTALPYLVDALFTTAIKDMIDNAGLANGTLVLNEFGGIGGQYIPTYIAKDPAVVRDIAARDAIAVEDRTNIVVVRNASADPTVGINPENAATRLLLHFDGSLLDDSTYNNTPIQVSPVGGAVFDTTKKKFGTSSLTLGGNTLNAHRITSIPASTAFTTEFMYYRDPSTVASTTVEFLAVVYNESATGDARNSMLRIGIAANTHHVFIQPQPLIAGANVVVDSTDINDGMWHRIGIRHTGTTVSLYVDDRLVGSSPHAYTDPINLISFGSLLQTGASITPGTYIAASETYYWAKGNIDEFRVVSYDKFASDTSIPTAPFAVNSNAASYIWDENSSDWVKISEYASMDVDFTDYVTQGDALTRLSDGSTYVRFTASERSELERLIRDVPLLASLETNNYVHMNGLFDTLSVRQDAVGTRLTDLETAMQDHADHILRDDEVVYFMSAPVSRFQ